jgi:uncharacterized protein (TIGR02145 family)
MRILSSILVCIFISSFIFTGCNKKNPTGSTPESENNTVTLTDMDGNVYQTVKIGDQWWMAENLKVTHYRNGDAMPNVTNNSDWSSLSSSAYCVYENNESNADTYGYLYNWYAVDDNRNIAPEGWHVPTDEEWKELEMHLGMSQLEADDTGLRGTDEGGKLKEAGTNHWQSPNTGATNESGFTALPSGYRYDYHYGLLDGIFSGMGTHNIYWSSTEYNSTRAWRRCLNYDYSEIKRQGNETHCGKNYGYSVRLVKD